MPFLAIYLYIGLMMPTSLPTDMTAAETTDTQQVFVTFTCLYVWRSGMCFVHSDGKPVCI